MTLLGRGGSGWVFTVGPHGQASTLVEPIHDSKKQTGADASNYGVSSKRYSGFRLRHEDVSASYQVTLESTEVIFTN
ncbi:hypothetical protein [Bythopirellula polymerisocia]|uniref:hypothetical protein n=1 Tax=Bythopirellula polymerisocia TaxID=2528003 RepID=UPI0011B62F4A|nr:hypothetical protein [Bythopirellula polymerisocia]